MKIILLIPRLKHAFMIDLDFQRKSVLFKTFSLNLTYIPDLYRGLPLITYAPRGRGGGQAFYTFPLRITCKKRGKGSR